MFYSLVLRMRMIQRKAISPPPSGVCPDKLYMLINKFIIMPGSNNHSLMSKYITEITQIIDIDGVYIDDTQVPQTDADTPLLHAFYEDASILDLQMIRARSVNKMSGSAILHLISSKNHAYCRCYLTVLWTKLHIVGNTLLSPTVGHIP